MQDMYEKFKKVFKSELSTKVVSQISIVAVALLVFFAIFSAGMIVGFHKASYGRAWGENYNENFGMGGKGMMANKFIMKRTGMMDFPNSHGAIGKIINIQSPNIIVEDRDSTEKVVLIDAETKIQRMRDTLTDADLKLGDFVVIIGTPNEQGVIIAKLIRILPSPELITP